jgi:type I phosphodiesterase/nucleotide pyrophosphatase
VGHQQADLAPPTRALAAIALCALVLAGCSLGWKFAKLGFSGDARELRDGNTERGARADRPTFLILGFDGMKRDVLYELLATGQVPGLASLLGGRDGSHFPHAYFDRTMLAPFPSVTIVGWAGIFSGAPPAVNGVTGNEIFIREERRMAAPIPGSFEAREPVLATYTDGYANALVEVPTLYERLREREPDIAAWVSVSQFYRGADRLLIAPRSALIDMFYARVRDVADGKAYAVFEERDQKVLDTVIDEIEDDDHPVPDVLTVYVSGTDGYAHLAPEGPDQALRGFMTGKVDEELAKLRRALERRGALANRYVVVVSDHGHSQVPHDGSTLLSAGATDAPPAVLTGAGFRLRPLQFEVAKDADFQAVLAYQGPVAYVYVADRSTCPQAGTPCDWSRPPRFGRDVLPVAEAFFRANHSGRYAPHMRHSLDMILTRRPRPYAEDDRPFEVYVGGGRLVPVGRYLASHPHPNWVAFEARLRELAVGRYGERAGDVILVARNGTSEKPDGRYYFNSMRQESVHGSASRADSEVTFILAHPDQSASQLEAKVHDALGATTRNRQVTDLVLRLRSTP